MNGNKWYEFYAVNTSKKFSLSFHRNKSKLTYKSGNCDSGTGTKRKEMAAIGVDKSDNCLEEEEKEGEEEEKGRKIRSSSELGNTYSLSPKNKIFCIIFGTVAG